MSKRVDPLIGKRISEKLTLIEKIGRGGMGTVYKARHEVLEKEFAVKILRSDMKRDPVVVERFKREARAASRLDHPNVVYISDFDQLSDGRFYIVMEYLPGKSLREIIEKESPLGEKRICNILLQISDALDYAHEMGIVHRDLKSENICINEKRGKEVVKILDFGLAKIISDALDLRSITSEGQIFGTPETMAPEQISSGKIDHRVDIYALGVLIFEILTSKTPFTGPMLTVLLAHKKKEPPLPSSKRNGLPGAFDLLVSKCMAKNPEDRFATAGEIHEILQDIYSKIVFKENGRKDKVKTFSNFKKEKFKAENTNQTWKENRFRQKVAEVAEHLRDRDIGSPKITQLLATILELEEKLFSNKSKLTTLLNQFDELEFTGRERASRLRHAIITLTLEMKNLISGNATSEVESDIRFQITELETRLKGVARGQSENEKMLETKIAKLRIVVDDFEYEIKLHNEQLWQFVDKARNEIGQSLTLKNSFAQMDELKKEIRK
jgi:serine/threonine protein kinase